jgi:hypothetical protein
MKQRTHCRLCGKDVALTHDGRRLYRHRCFHGRLCAAHDERYPRKEPCADCEPVRLEYEAALFELYPHRAESDHTTAAGARAALLAQLAEPSRAEMDQQIAAQLRRRAANRVQIRATPRTVLAGVPAIDAHLESALAEYLPEFAGYTEADFLSFVAAWLQRRAGAVGDPKRDELEIAVENVALSIATRRATVQ